MGTRIAPLVARVSSLHEALVHPTLAAAAAAAASKPHAAAAYATHLGLFLTEAQLVSRPDNHPRAADIGTKIHTRS